MIAGILTMNGYSTRRRGYMARRILKAVVSHRIEDSSAPVMVSRPSATERQASNSEHLKAPKHHAKHRRTSSGVDELNSSGSLYIVFGMSASSPNSGHFELPQSPFTTSHYGYITGPFKRAEEHPHPWDLLRRDIYSALHAEAPHS